MKRKRYSDEQIAFALRQTENGTLVEASAAHGPALRLAAACRRRSGPCL